jgi:hypothetical protein
VGAATARNGIQQSAIRWLIQIEQKAHEREALAPRKLNDFLGYLLYGSGHVFMLGVKADESSLVRR